MDYLFITRARRGSSYKIRYISVFTGLPVWQTESGSAFSLFGLFIFLFFSVSVKVLPVTPLLSGVFVHRAFCAYFLRIERVVGNA